MHPKRCPYILLLWVWSLRSGFKGNFKKQTVSICSRTQGRLGAEQLQSWITVKYKRLSFFRRKVPKGEGWIKGVSQANIQVEDLKVDQRRLQSQKKLHLYVQGDLRAHGHWPNYPLCMVMAWQGRDRTCTFLMMIRLGKTMAMRCDAFSVWMDLWTIVTRNVKSTAFFLSTRSLLLIFRNRLDASDIACSWRICAGYCSSFCCFCCLGGRGWFLGGFFLCSSFSQYFFWVLKLGKLL